MVVLDVADEEVPRLIVQKLRPAVEEGGVVFVSLEDEVRPRAAPVAPAEVAHLAPDEESGIPSRVEKQPGRQGRRRRLAVGAGDDDGNLVRQQILAHGLRQGKDGDASPRRFGGLDVVARRRVPDDDRVAVRRDVLGGKALEYRDLERFEQGRHRRIKIEVASGDPVPGFCQESRQGDHGGSADADHVKAF